MRRSWGHLTSKNIKKSVKLDDREASETNNLRKLKDSALLKLEEMFSNGNLDEDRYNRLKQQIDEPGKTVYYRNFKESLEF